MAVSQENEQKFLDKMTGSKTTFLGTVDDTDVLTITDGFESVISTKVQDMVQSWQKTLDMTGGNF